MALDISSFQSHYREMVFQTTGVALALLLFGVLVILFFGIVQRYELAHLSIEKLKRIKRLLGHFVPDFAKRMIEKDPEKKGLLDKYVQDATILFLDVEGFTALLQQYPQERINRTIEGYFSAYLDVIRKNGGDINETAGDGMMVIFLDPDPARHAARAAQAAGEIRLKTETLSKEARAGENALIPIQVNMGLQSGQVYLGSTKMRAREGERWTFTASGEATIVAARLADHATGGRILLGQETARRIDGSVPQAAMGKIQLKNLPSPEEVYEALPGAERSSPTATGSLS